MTETELLQGCLRENRAAQHELFRRYSGKMMTVCLRYARHRAEAEDVLQDAFIRIFNNLNQFQGKGSLEGWIRRIVINTSLKNIQKMSFQKEGLSGLEAIPEMSIVPDVYALMSEQELMALIAKLPQGYRTVFNLFVIDGFNHSEIAQMLKIEEGTSRSQLAKARYMLQKFILQQSPKNLNAQLLNS
jgi:RNA polymerase sigma-70 factor (ECF subfamily)